MQGHNEQSDMQHVLTRPWGIGGSDIGAIVGLSPYKSAVDVWLEKVGRREATAQQGIHLRFGHHLEPFVASEYERVTGHATVVLPQTLHHKGHPHLFAHIDRLVSKGGREVTNADGSVSTDTLLECKTASAFTSDQWGPEWSDQVPPAYIAQCAWYMAITGCNEAHLAVLLGNSDFRVYKLLRDIELEEALIESANNFWQLNVLAEVPPEPVSRLEVAKLYPCEVRGRDIEADDELLGQIRSLGRTQRLQKRLEIRSAYLNEQLTLRMQDAERICSQGKTLATWRASSPPQRIDVPRLRRERPDLVSEYVVEGTPSRRLVLSGARDA